MRPRLIIHMKSGKTVGATMDPADIRDYLLRYSDWCAVGEQPESAPVIDFRDPQGAGLVVPFSSIEYMEAEGR